MTFICSPLGHIDPNWNTKIINTIMYIIIRFFKGCFSNVLRGTGGALVLVFDAKIKAALYGGEAKLGAGSG